MKHKTKGYDKSKDSEYIHLVDTRGNSYLAIKLRIRKKSVLRGKNRKKPRPLRIKKGEILDQMLLSRGSNEKKS